MHLLCREIESLWVGLQAAAEFDSARFDADEVNRAFGNGHDAGTAVRRAA